MKSQINHHVLLTTMCYITICVCVCVAALLPKRLDRFWWNFLQMIWQIFARSVFLGFWKFEMMTSWRPFCSLSFAALSRSQFWSDFLQNWWGGRKLSSAVCYLKSARSVGNFRQYGGPRFRKNSKWPPKIKFLKQGKWGVYYDWNWPADHEYDDI